MGRQIRVLVAAMGVLVPALVASAAAATSEGVGDAQSGFAESPRVGHNFWISGSAATGYDDDPTIAHNSTDNQYLVVWVDGRKVDTRGEDIFGQLVTSDGERLGHNFRLSGKNATDHESSPAVVYNQIDNQYLVVWVDNRYPGGGTIGQLVSSEGERIGPNFRISAGRGGGAEPAIAYNSTSNQYLVVWPDGRNPGRSLDIYGQLLGADGQGVGRNFRISGIAGIDTERFPKVAHDSTTNQYVVVWMDWRNTESRGVDIYGQLITADGERLGHNFRICGHRAVAHEWDPAVAYDPRHDRYLVVWSDGRNTANRGWDLYGQLVTAEGERVRSNSRISGENTGGDEFEPVITYTPSSGEYLVVWRDTRSWQIRGEHIFGQRVTADGKPVGHEFSISGPKAIDREKQPAVAHNSTDNQYLVTWQDGRNGESRRTDIYGQLIAVGPS